MSIAEKLTAVAENQQRVYDAGFTAGQAEGGGGGYTQEEMDKAVADAIEDGKQAEYDRFWDDFQQNGERRHYWGGFCRWSDETFKPKYPLVMKEHGYAFRDSMITVLPPITIVDSSVVQLLYDARYLKSVEKLTFQQRVTKFSTTFQNCTALEHIIIDGEIAGAVSFQHSSLLDNESIQSIIDSLVDLTGQTALTLTLHATVGANLTDEQKATITAKNWTLVY